MTPLEFPDWLGHRASTTPARTALITGGITWTFADLDAEVDDVAQRLALHGVGAGDRVATLLRNGLGPALFVHAVLRLGATLVPLNYRLRESELAWQLGDAAPRLVIVEERTAPLVTAARAELPELQVVTLGSVASAAVEGPTGRARDRLAALDIADTRTATLRLSHPADHILAIIYTSGTTGTPKGAMLTVANFWWSAVGSALNLGTQTDDRWLVVLPLFHVGGLSILLRSAIYGVAAVVHDGFDAVAANRAIDEEGISIVSVVAVMLQRMLEAHGDVPYPETFRCALLGGGPAPQPLLERCARIGIPVVQTYGLTETASQVATLAPEDALRKLGAAGRPLYPNEIRIAAPAGAGSGASGAGEILVRGPIVMAGYAGRPDATAQALRDGWLHTGDVGQLDAEGYLYVLDRRDDLIVSGGENVYPAEVEAALLAHPAVAEAAVIGVPDDTWGQRVRALVRLRDGATAAPEEMREFCRTRLAGYKVPREVWIVTEPLPRTASGKIRRAEVRGVT